jgi:perosamine synthetase
MAHLAPAGTPVALTDIFSGLLPGAGGAASLAAQLRALSGLPHAWALSSGRAGMVLILRAMKVAAADPGRDEVIVPAYTCYSVPAAIELAGLKPRLCDIDPATLGMDPAALARCDFSRTLAVISANLYGMPDDLVALERLCRERNVYLLDDAAQALGASVGNRASGSFGDAGLYSFDKGKIISTMQGGAIVCRDATLAAAIDRQVSALPPSPAGEAFGNFAKLLIYSVCLRPSLYGLVRALPGAPVGRTPYETSYPITTLTAFQTALAARLFSRIPRLNEARREHARRYEAALRGLPLLAPVTPVAQAHGAYARFPVRVRDAARRPAVIAALEAAGIGATASYPLSLGDVPEVVSRLPAQDRHCEAAREVARTIVTLPTHAYCPPDVATRVRAVLEALR